MSTFAQIIKLFWSYRFICCVDLANHLCINIIVENNDQKSTPVEMMTEEIESELLKEYPQLPVARQNEGELTFMCNSYCGHVLIRKCINYQTSCGCRFKTI